MNKLFFIFFLAAIFANNSQPIVITDDSKVEVYSALFWGPCKEAKELLQSRGIEYTTKMITFSRKNTKELMKKTGGKTSMPQIFIDDYHIGGLNELKTHLK